MILKNLDACSLKLYNIICIRKSYKLIKLNILKYLKIKLKYKIKIISLEEHNHFTRHI
jgi:hypothetical protein